MLKPSVYRLLDNDPELLAELRTEAMGDPNRSRSSTVEQLFWEEGRRSFAAEMVESYDEVNESARKQRMAG